MTVMCCMCGRGLEEAEDKFIKTKEVDSKLYHFSMCEGCRVLLGEKCAELQSLKGSTNNET